MVAICSQGGSIILFTPGESSAEGQLYFQSPMDFNYSLKGDIGLTPYFTNVTMNGQIAQQQNGAAILLEHRHYGLSTPTPDLSTPNLKYHTI